LKKREIIRAEGRWRSIYEEMERDREREKDRVRKRVD